MIQPLVDLFSVSPAQRDSQWQRDFYRIVPQASLRALHPQVIEGPDGFSYFALAFPRPHEDFESFTVDHILEFCLEHGFGIVILAPPAKEPLWVFRYGDLLSYKYYQNFEGDPADEDKGEPSVPRQITAPTESLLPSTARHLIKSFLKKKGGMVTPSVAMLVDNHLHPRRNLIFNLYRNQVPQSVVYDDVMHQLLWFLPRSRGIVEPTPTIIQPSQFHVM